MSREQDPTLSGWTRLAIVMSVTALIATILAVAPTSTATSATNDVAVIVLTTGDAGTGTESLV